MPFKLSKKLDIVKKESQLSNPCIFQSMQIWSWRNEAYSNKKLQENTGVDKSLLDFNSERFCDTVLRENYKLKPKTHMKRTQSNNRGIYIHQNNEVEEKFSPILFIYVGTNFEHQV